MSGWMFVGSEARFTLKTRVKMPGRLIAVGHCSTRQSTLAARRVEMSRGRSSLWFRSPIHRSPISKSSVIVKQTQAISPSRPHGRITNPELTIRSIR